MKSKEEKKIEKWDKERKPKRKEKGEGKRSRGRGTEMKRERENCQKGKWKNGLLRNKSKMERRDEKFKK